LKHLARHARITGGLAALLVLMESQGAHADGFTKDQLGTVTKPADDQNRPEWMRKMAGSSAELSSYVGSGTFYSSGYRDPYVSTAVFARPTYDLGTRFKLSANARFYLEEELTTSDLPNGRRFTPYDIWLWLSAKELHKFETAKVRLGAVARVVVPISYEKRYAHMLTGLAGGLNLTRAFEFGTDPAPERRWNLTTAVGGVFTKYFYTSDLRGNFPGDSTGCRGFIGAGLATGSNGGPSGSESDHCGGPVNTNFSVTTSGTVSLARGKWSLAAILLIANSFHYQVPHDASSAITANDVGREDTTWGIVSLGYSFTDHLGASLGVSSYQPAMDLRYQHLRFPFLDLSGGANQYNFTQAFVSLSGTL
jgi:hypothetical protein